MTLADLVRRAEATGRMMGSMDIKVKLDGYPVEIYFEPVGQSELTYAARAIVNKKMI